MAPVFLVCVAASVTCSACKQGRLVFPVACLARYLSSMHYEAQKEETRPVCFCSYVLSYMCFCVLTCVFGEWGGCLGLRREGGSATALTDFQAPRHDRKPPLPLPSPSAYPCRGRCQIQHSIHETNTNSHCSLLRGLQRLCKTFGRKSLFISQP